MKNKIQWMPTALVLLVILQGYSLTLIGGLSDSVNRLEGRLHTTKMALEQSVNGISNTIRRGIEEETALLSQYSLEYGEVNWETLTRKATVKAIPKAYADDAEVYFIYAGQSYPLTETAGSFSATVDLPLFSDDTEGQFLIEDVGGKRQQLANFYETPYYTALPWLEALNSHQYQVEMRYYSGDKQQPKNFMDIRLPRSIFMKASSANPLTSVSLEVLADGEVLHLKELSFQDLEEDIQENLEIPSGKLIVVNLLLEDQQGFHYSYNFQEQTAIHYDNSSTTHSATALSAGTFSALTVTDPQGNLLLGHPKN